VNARLLQPRRLLSASSIFIAEANAMLLALKSIASSECKFITCSDYLSCLLAIEKCKGQNPFILKTIEMHKSLVDIGKHIIFTWIPCHIGINWNAVVDQAAMNTLDNPISNCSIRHTNFKSFTVKYL
jgi:hypothetical protein